jgi:hypothetical protein
VPTTSKLGLRYPSLSDAPNGPLAVQNLASDVDALGVLGGKRRTAASSNITTIEAIVVDTQTLSLAASSVFQIDYDLVFNSSVASSDVLMKIRLTSVSGTILGQAIAANGAYTTQGSQGHLTVLYKTTAAELQYFAGTVIRQGGTGNITAIVPTSMTVTNIGPSTIIGDF